MTDPLIPPAAQLVYTTSLFTSPQFIGAIVAAIVFGAQRGLGVEIDIQTQGMIAMAVGWALGWVVKWFFPGSDGRLRITAPAAFNVPATINVPVGVASVVTIPAERDEVQVATVTLLPIGEKTVTVERAKGANWSNDIPAAPMTVMVGTVK